MTRRRHDPCPPRRKWRRLLARVPRPTVVIAGTLGASVAIVTPIGWIREHEGAAAAPLVHLPSPAVVAEPSAAPRAPSRQMATVVSGALGSDGRGVTSVAVSTGAAERTTTPAAPATARAVAVRVRNARVIDPLGPVTSPDAGPFCASGLTANDLSAFFGSPIGSFQGADYQRAHRLPDGRVLWSFQDAFIDGRLVHNAAMVQSGSCFTVLNQGAHPWLLADRTSDFRRWHWVMGMANIAGGERVALFVVEFRELGSSYLQRARPVQVRRVELDVATLTLVAVHDEPVTADDLFGWSVTADADHTYLYSHCYQQFGYDGPLGFGACVADVKVARVPAGRVDLPREYWTGSGWSPDHTQAVAVVDGSFAMSGNNPAQIQFDGARFLLIEKRDDWFGTTVEVGVAPSATGPFRRVTSLAEPLACDRSVCNTYFASWVPWRDPDGSPIWSISRNVWNGTDTWRELDRYRPTFSSVAIPLV